MPKLNKQRPIVDQPLVRNQEMIQCRRERDRILKKRDHARQLLDEARQEPARLAQACLELDQESTRCSEKIAQERQRQAELEAERSEIERQNTQRQSALSQKNEQIRQLKMQLQQEAEEQKKTLKEEWMKQKAHFIEQDERLTPPASAEEVELRKLFCDCFTLSPPAAEEIMRKLLVRQRKSSVDTIVGAGFFKPSAQIASPATPSSAASQSVDRQNGR